VYRVYTVGMGNAPIKAEGKAVRTRGGRVEISLLKNGLGDLASSAPVNASVPGNTGGVSGAATNAAPASNQTEQPSTPATNVTPASQEPQGSTGVTTEKPSPSAPSKPPVR
jgi:hypothetical protein